MIQPSRCPGILQPSFVSIDQAAHTYSCEALGPDAGRKPSSTVEGCLIRLVVRLSYILKMSEVDTRTQVRASGKPNVTLALQYMNASGESVGGQS